MAHLLVKATHRKYDVCLPSVSELIPQIHVWRFRGKVLRKFAHLDPDGETLDLIFADSKGDRIHATILPGDVSFFSGRLDEGNWVLLVDFELIPVEGEFRITTHPFKIRFTRNTACVNVYIGNTNCFFSFVDLELISETTTSHSVDLIGKVVNVGNFSDRANSLGMSKRKIIRFFLENCRGFRIPCYLTNHYADTFIRGLGSSNRDNDVCVLRFARIIIRRGIFIATSAFACTQVLMNPPISDVSSLMGP